MRTGRPLLALLLWVPCAVLVGPIVGLRHGLAQLAGGAMVMSTLFVTAWAWQKLDGPASGRPAYRAAPPGVAGYAGLVVGLALILSTYGHTDRWYTGLMTYPREVVVTEAGCRPAKHGCDHYAVLSTPDGHRLPLQLYHVAAGRTAGEALTVRWDRLGYTSPTSTTHAGTAEPDGSDQPLVPASAFLSVAVLHAALTAFFAYRGHRRRTHSPSETG